MELELMIGEGEIPTGWCLGKKDGSKKLYYYCPGTGQHFFKYSDLIRYIEYAKEKQVGIYSLCRKSIKRQRKVELDSRATEPKKKTFCRFSSLSIPKKPSVSNSLTVVDQRNLEEESRATEYKKALSVLSIPKKTSESNSLTALDLIAEYESPTASESTNEGDEDYVPESDCDDLAESDTLDEEKQIVKEEMDDLKAP